MSLKARGGRWEYYPRKAFSLTCIIDHILEYAKEHGRVSISEIAALTGKSKNTLKAYFRKLVEQGHLEQKGGGRASWYQLK